jgi:short-subunit dehydrogenase
MRILITGASQGIGRALAEAATRRGAKLVLVARSEDRLHHLAAELRAGGAAVEAVVADVTNPADRQRMLQAAVDRFGGLDILINNAGIGATGHFAEASEERLRKIMEVNFFALAETIRLAVPILRNGNRPMIVNISSVVGKRALPARSEYSASKYAVQGLSEALRAELVRYGIDVLVVCPGLTATNFPQNMIENRAKWPMDHKRSMTAAEVAEQTLRAIEKGKREVVLTGAGRLLVWLNRFFPRLVDALVARKVRSLYRDEMEARTRRPHEQEKREEVEAAR